MTAPRRPVERPGSFSIRSTPSQTDVSVDIEMNGYGSATRQRSGFTSPITYGTQVEIDQSNNQPETPRRKFRGRHIQMMGLGTTRPSNHIISVWYTNKIGAAIGSGVLYNSGTPLFLAGPVSLFLAYLWVGTVVYSMLESQNCLAKVTCRYLSGRWSRSFPFPAQLSLSQFEC
jgi:amino acid permease